MELSKAGRQTVQQGLAAHGKACANRSEEQFFILDPRRRGLPHFQTDHGACYLRLGHKAGGRHIKQQFRLGMIIAQDGKSRIVRTARLRADPLRHFLLHHDRDRVKTLAFQQLCQHRRCDIVRQIRTGKRLFPSEFFLHQRRKIRLQRITEKDFQIVKFPYGVFQNWLKRCIHFQRDDLPCTQAKLLRQRTKARADLQNTAGFINFGGFRNPLRHPSLCQKILPLRL